MKYYVGGILDLENHPFLNSYVPLPIRSNPPYNISPTDDYSHSCLVSAGLSSHNLYILSGLPSNISATNPNPFQPPRSILETDNNQMNLNSTSILDAYVPQVDPGYMGESYNVIPDYTMNPFQSNMNHIDWISSTEGYVFPQTNLNIISPQANTNNLGWVSSGETYVPSGNMICSTIQEGFVQSETNNVVLNRVIPPETYIPIFQNNINYMGMASLGESYVLPQDIVIYESNMTNMSLVSRDIGYRISSETNTTVRETNISNMDWVPFEESYGNMISSGPNMTEVDLVPFETTHAVVESVIPPETNVEDTSLVRYDDGYDVSLTDLILFDDNVIEMDIQSCLGNYGSSDRNVSSSTINLSHNFDFSIPTCSIPNITTEGQDHSFAMDLRSTNQHHTNIEGESNVDNDREVMDWIEEILNTDA